MTNIQELSEFQKVKLASIAKQVGLTEIYQNMGVLDTPSSKILNQFITEDIDLIEQKRIIKLITNENEPVLILGETGTGKELFARALHGNRTGKFIAVNITALPTELIESELFGHARGSFTGAIIDRKGLFQEAENGTLFLDEIGYMPIYAQAKLLRVLEDKQIRQVGSNESINVNCRIVCATRLDLQKQIDNDKFLEDLFWRLQFYIIKTKPLRQRREDIREIMDATLDTQHLIPEDIRDKWINKYDFYGNVRELQAKCKRYIITGKE